jgi:hypothetical protein
MKKSVRLCSLILCVLMFTGMFTACSGGGKKVSTGDTYTYWVPLDGNVSHTSASLNEHYMFEQMEKAYMPRLRAADIGYYKHLLGQIIGIISNEPEREWNKPLNDIYLIGYFLQRTDLNVKNSLSES